MILYQLVWIDDNLFFYKDCNKTIKYKFCIFFASTNFKTLYLVQMYSYLHNKGKHPFNS